MSISPEAIKWAVARARKANKSLSRWVEDLIAKDRGTV